MLSFFFSKILLVLAVVPNYLKSNLAYFYFFWYPLIEILTIILPSNFSSFCLAHRSQIITFLPIFYVLDLSSGGAHLLWNDLQHRTQWIKAVVVLEEFTLQNTQTWEGHLNNSTFESSVFDNGLAYIQLKWKYLLQLAVEHFEIADLFLIFFILLSSRGSFSSEEAMISSFYFFSGGYVPFVLHNKQTTKQFLQSGHEYLIFTFSFSYSSLQLSSGNEWLLRNS